MSTIQGKLRQIDGLTGKKNYPDALSMLQDLMDKGSGCSEVYNRAGYIYGETGRFEEAIDVFKKVVALEPDNPDPYHEVANMYKMKGCYVKAMDYYKKALVINPDRPVSVEGVNTCRMRIKLLKVDEFLEKGETDGALSELGRILSEEGPNLEIYEKMAYIHGLKDQYDKATELYKKVVNMNPGREEPYHELGNMYKMKGQYNEAIKEFQKSLSINPDRAVSVSGIGFCYKKKNDNRRAVKYFKKAIELDRKETESYKNLLDLYAESHDRKGIDEIYGKLKDLSRTDDDVKTKYLYVKAVLYRDYRSALEKGENLRSEVEKIYSRDLPGTHSGGQKKEIIDLLINDFSLEGRHLRTTGGEAGAMLKYNSILSVDPENEEAKKGLYFTEKYLHKTERPHFCAISISFGCMLKCRMCRIWESQVRDEELSQDTWKGIIDDLSEFMDENKTMNFAGGEPLLRKDLVELINYSGKKGFKPAICTNGWLIDEDMAKRLVDSGLDIVALSLDSLDERTHDYIRGVEGSYRRARNAVDNLVKYNKDKKIRVHIQPIISAINLPHLIELTHWVHDHPGLGDITFLATIQPPNTNSDYQEWYRKEEFEELWPKDMDLVNSVMDELSRLKLSDKATSYKIGNQVFQLQAYKSYFSDPLSFYKKKVQCNIGEQFVNVHINGDVKLCHYSDVVIGNLARQRISEFWESKAANNMRKQIKVCERKCHQILNCMKDENPYLK